ncbi:neuropeptide FF receptor 1-like [Nematostella vectensis]|uniref:neuropeptide FF receptor 1-like n=1 Tax=Nematostella vectensis TaxID=45351 RepID=UPI0013900A62|nr:neuropeptide FF receptor 1-like [Nematostella vectensis]
MDITWSQNCTNFKESNCTNLSGDSVHCSYIWLGVNLALVLPNFIGNTLVCLTIIKTKPLHNFCNFLLVNLAISDMVLGVLDLLSVVLALLSDNTSSMNVRLVAFCVVEVSIFTVTAISFERYTAIVKPFQRLGAANVGRLKIVIPVLWILGIVFNIPSFILFLDSTLDDHTAIDSHLDKNLASAKVDGVVHFLVCYVVPSLVMWVTYFKIVQALQRRSRVVGTNSSSSALKAQKKVARLLGLVILSHNIFFLPFSVTSVLVMVFGLPNMSLFLDVFYYLQFLSPIANPFIYWVHSQKFRNSFRDIIGPYSK